MKYDRFRCIFLQLSFWLGLFLGFACSSFTDISFCGLYCFDRFEFGFVYSELVLWSAYVIISLLLLFLNASCLFSLLCFVKAFAFSCAFMCGVSITGSPVYCLLFFIPDIILFPALLLIWRNLMS